MAWGARGAQSSAEVTPSTAGITPSTAGVTPSTAGLSAGGRDGTRGRCQGADARAAVSGNALENTGWAAHGAWSSTGLFPPPPPQTLGCGHLLPALGRSGVTLDLSPVFFPSIKEGDFLPSVFSLFFGFLWEWGRSLCRNPLLLEDRTRLSPMLREAREKHEGLEHLAPRALLLEWGKRK